MQTTSLNPAAQAATPIYSAAPGLTPAMNAAQRSKLTGPSPKLVAAAHEFEAQMMKELLKPLASSGVSGSGDSDDENSGGALGAYATEAFGRALSNGGGFGIAKSILSSLSRSQTSTPLTPVTGQTHADTQIKNHK
jgi:Rod binding domain-containing protein